MDYLDTHKKEMEEQEQIIVVDQCESEDGYFLASLIAAATFVPEEIPHIIPSFDANCLDVCIASSSVTIQMSS